MSDPQVYMEKIVSPAKRRGFIFPGSEMYGWDLPALNFFSLYE